MSINDKRIQARREFDEAVLLYANVLNRHNADPGAAHERCERVIQAAITLQALRDKETP